MRFERAAVAVAACITSGLHAQARNLLPAPTGPAPIGRVTYHWMDSSRVDPLASGASARREVMIDVWYPAARSVRPPASYFPYAVTLQQALPDSVLLRRYAPMYGAVRAGLVVPHAAEGGDATCPASGCPLLVFSHGGGVDRSAYTAQYEDLASHGYVVAAVAHPRLTHTIVFPDSRVVRLAPRPRELMSADSTVPLWRRQIGASAAWGNIRYHIAAADVRFVIDRMIDLARDRSLASPFHGKIDLQRIGALGHSMGGLAATLACASDVRIKACMNQDGTAAALTVVKDSSGRALAQPYMYFGRVEPPAPPGADTVLARIQMTRAEEDSLATLRPRQHDSVFTALPGGAWRVRLMTPGAKHMSFSDEPLVETAGDSTGGAAALLALDVIRRYTRAFFDKTLHGRKDTPLDRLDPRDSVYVTVERFSAPDRPTFTSVSIARSGSTAPGSRGIRLQPDGGVIASGVTLRELIEFAYQRHRFDLRAIVGGPSWIDSERFDVTVKAENEHRFHPDASTPSTWTMMRHMLAERFALAVEEKTEGRPVYALVADTAGKGFGPRLRPSDVDCGAIMTARTPPPQSEHGPPCAAKTPKGWLIANTITMASLASLLSRHVDRPVIDHSGFSRRFDVVLESADIAQAPDHRPGPSDARLTPARPIPIHLAVREQLGLRLDPKIGQVPVVLVRRAERPAIP